MLKITIHQLEHISIRALTHIWVRISGSIKDYNVLGVVCTLHLDPVKKTCKEVDAKECYEHEAKDLEYG
jgi:hypothetical protein